MKQSIFFIGNLSPPLYSLFFKNICHQQTWSVCFVWLYSKLLKRTACFIKLSIKSWGSLWSLRNAPADSYYFWDMPLLFLIQSWCITLISYHFSFLSKYEAILSHDHYRSDGLLHHHPLPLLTKLGSLTEQTTWKRSNGFSWSINHFLNCSLTDC